MHLQDIGMQNIPSLNPKIIHINQVDKDATSVTYQRYVNQVCRIHTHNLFLQEALQKKVTNDQYE